MTIGTIEPLTFTITRSSDTLFVSLRIPRCAMKLKSIFEKPVDRPIEGVIKADDEASLRLELDEYILTNEVEKRLEAFLEAYNTYQGANGVWVSGFFGSGKSHLLKMLALLLENRRVEGCSALDLFLAKCGSNKFLQAELQRAAMIPSKSILFNIDQKADVISKTEFDALLSVFVKVFNEMRGYYGKLGHIARFERDLESRGLYGAFKAEYQEIANKPWERGREQAVLESVNIAKAYANVTQSETAAEIGLLDKYRQEYRVSIEDFAEEVRDYIDQQSPQFRLNFFVDEVGQYIAEHVKLMTNLQTIAESLATKCQGRAWIVVTAQEDMNTVLGEMGRQQSNDFTKIQARFNNRMKLTSQDVAEVIQKRLLKKQSEGTALLAKVYQAQVNNFKTLFDFADGSMSYRNFQDQEHFVNSYPFIPYQFPLFQTAIQKLSQHNAFEGKHSSVGERSMLGVFQAVAIQIQSQEVGQLATFDLMFEGIRTTLKSSIQSAVLMAERQCEDEFAVRLLKALFLVKYVKEFKATVRNLCVLMLERFEQNLGELRTQVQGALDFLEQQTYIQRQGDLYEYLTDEEKDVEQEIKNTEVENAAVMGHLADLVFDQVIKHSKIRCGKNQDYPFTRKVDDKLYSREQELAIHIISPFNEHIDQPDWLQMQSMGRDELLVLMPADDRLMRDLVIYQKTEKYVQQNVSLTQQETIKRILTDKSFQNKERGRELQERVKRLLGKAQFYIAGTECEIGGEDALNRIYQAFNALVDRVYSNLGMLQGIAYSESEVGKYLQYSEEGLFGGDATVLAEAEREVLAAVQSNHRSGLRMTLKALVDKFEHKPYGWAYGAVLCQVAKLCARGKVEVRLEGTLLEEGGLEAALKNSRNHANVILAPQVEFTAAQVRGLKDFYANFFDRPAGTGEAKVLAKETGEAFQELSQELSPYESQVGQYPFLEAMGPVLAAIKECCGKSYSWYLTELRAQEERLLDLKEDVIDPLRRFMSGTQKEIYDEARLFVEKQRLNFGEVAEADAAAVQAILADRQCFRGNKMQDLKARVEQLRGEIAQRVSQEIAHAQAQAQSLQIKLQNAEGFAALSEEQQQRLMQPFRDFEAEVAQQEIVDVIQNKLSRFEDQTYSGLLSQLDRWVQPSPVGPKKTGEEPGTGGVAEKGVEYVTCKSVAIQFDKAYLADEADVADYLAAMKEALLAEIRNGKRIQI